MADTKVTGLTENTTPALTDIIYIVDDPGGSAASQKITLANLKTIVAGRVLISEQSPTGATVTWDSIPNSYNSLEVELMGRTDKASVANEAINLYFNNDTTAGNYYSQNLSGTATTASTVAADNASVITIPAATATANYAGYSLVRIPDYADTTFHKIARILNGRRDDATNGFVSTRVMFWESTVAITRVDLVTASSGNFISGTRARLYGIY